MAVLVADSENLRANENTNVLLKALPNVCLRLSEVLSVGPVLLSSGSYYEPGRDSPQFVPEHPTGDDPGLPQGGP